MPAYKSLVIGHSIRQAGRRRYCAHNKDHVILKGESVLEVATNPGKNGYCTVCADAMIRKAEAELRRMTQELGGD